LNNKLSLLIFSVFILLLYVGLNNDSRLVQSPLINKKLPEFNLPILQSESLAEISTFPDDTFLLNVWASWCIECIREHQVLNLIENDDKIRLIGINYKDLEIDAIGWLEIYGNPYEYIIYDRDGQLGIDLGVYGVPETFLVDKNKVIRAKYIGVINEDIYYNEILPTIEKIKDDY
tara:strand:+ start:582 stop:1106 length:525 start_codon:yes stop_codon:yes gene_type:complete